MLIISQGEQPWHPRLAKGKAFNPMQLGNDGQLMDPYHMLRCSQFLPPLHACRDTLVDLRIEVPPHLHPNSATAEQRWRHEFINVSSISCLRVLRYLSLHVLTGV